MSEKKKKNTPQEEQPQADTAPETEQAAEKAAEEETFTVTREQMEQMEQLAKVLADANDKYLRLAAEYDNYRKRNASLRTEVADDTVRETIKEILPSLDNLERALDAAKKAGEESSLLKGVEMTLRGFEEALNKMGLERVEAAPGTVFDPEKHNAVMMTEADEEHPEGTIVECFQTGFAVKGKVVRYAMVRVAN